MQFYSFLCSTVRSSAELIIKAENIKPFADDQTAYLITVTNSAVQIFIKFWNQSCKFSISDKNVIPENLILGAAWISKIKEVTQFEANNNRVDCVQI